MKAHNTFPRRPTFEQSSLGRNFEVDTIDPISGLKQPVWLKRDLRKLFQKSESANWDDMGCVSGDSIIRVLIGSRVKDWTLREAYLGFNHLHPDKRKNWKSDLSYKTLSLVDGRIRHHTIRAIHKTGTKKVIRLQFFDRFVDVTPDHLVLRGNEWVEAKSVQIGDELIVWGEKGEKYGRYRGSGYPQKAVRTTSGWTVAREHVLVAERPRGMVVHHDDEDKTNNHPANLSVISKSEHSRIHARDQIASYDAPPLVVIGIEERPETDVYDITMDIPHHNYVANGVVVHNCFKTSQALWLIKERTKETEKPCVLVVTTRSGKGTYFQLAQRVLPDWEIYNVQRQKTRLVLDDMELEVPFPENGSHPKLFVTHYDVFTERKKKKRKKAELPLDAEEEVRNEMLEELIEEHAKTPQGLLDIMLKIKWDFIVLDEAHRIKNRKTGWTKNIKRLKAHNKHVMTGTGFINRPDEIWSLLHFLEPRRWPSYWRFRERYCDEFTDWSGIRRIRGINPDTKEEFKQLIRSFGPRRTKREVFRDLPEPIFTTLEVELNPTQRRMYEAIRDELHAYDQKGLPLVAPNVLAALSRLRQICVATPDIVRDYYDPVAERRVQEIRLIEPSSKLDALMEVIEGLEWDEERRDQIVVFSNFKDPIELAKARFEKAGISYIHLQQKDNDRQRYEKWAIEFPKKEHQVFIVTLQLGSESISLTPAQNCVFLDRSWSPKDNEQGVSRVWRPGQTETPNILYIHAKDTSDDRVLRTNEVKVGWFKEIFG